MVSTLELTWSGSFLLTDMINQLLGAVTSKIFYRKACHNYMLLAFATLETRGNWSRNAS